MRLGRAAPVRVLLHGFGSNSGTFQQLLPYLQQRGSLVLVDLPGHGRSAPSAAAPHPEAMAAAIAERLKTLDLGTFELVGHSLGGLVATGLSMLMRPQVERLALISCAGVGPDLDMAFFRAFVAGRSPENLVEHLALAYANPPVDLIKVARGVVQWLDRPGVRAYVTCIVEAAETFYADVAGALAAGVQIRALWGARDRIAPQTNADHLPAGVPLTVLSKVSHVPHIEAPAEVARWLLHEPVTG